MRAFSLLLLLLFSATAHAALPARVDLDSGRIEGLPGRQAEVMVYKGIPYAAPPVGQNRWREPQAVAAWSGLRPADAFGPRCVQGGFAPGAEQALSSEDCLYLNVWSPAEDAGEALPVLVWVHGGGFFGGAGSDARYDGENLARQGAVVVTLNYRLGSFGFLAHPELSAESPRGSSGNYALLDMLAALQWVQRNIAAFGGDAAKVTLMGESAGAFAVASLVASPLSEGLFQGAIAQSGGWMGLSMTALPTLAEREAEGVAQLEAFGAADIDELRQASAQEIFSHFPGAGTVTVDGYFLPRDPSLIFAAGEQQAVDLIAGSNADEAVFFGPGIQEAEAFRDYARDRFGELAADFLALYPAGSDAEAAASYRRSYSDELAWQTRRLAGFQSARGRQGHAYHFSRVPPGEEVATHVTELAYMFNQHDQQPRWSGTDRELADAMSRYWVNLAAGGDPNGAALPHWPAYPVQGHGEALELGDEVEALAPDEELARRLGFFDRAHQRLLEQLQSR